MYELKLSILDQSPVSANMTAKDALEASICLAEQGERLGYERYWIAEHHDLFGLACPNPSVMLGMIGARTHSLRIGAGAVLLPYYKPFHVAETYNLLATLFPGRIDLGLGRAPGGSAEVSLALSDNYLAGVRKFPEHVQALQDYLTVSFNEENPDANISPTPIPDVSPALWLLGTSKRSAILAAEKGLSYAFGHFMTDKNGPEIVEDYRVMMQEKHEDNAPYVIIAVSVICAETTEEAHDLALSYFLWTIRQEKPGEELRIPSVEEAKQYEFTAKEREKIEEIEQKMLIGNPEDVKLGLTKLDEKYKADEYMIITIVYDVEAKVSSYELIKKVMND